MEQLGKPNQTNNDITAIENNQNKIKIKFDLLSSSQVNNQKIPSKTTNLTLKPKNKDDIKLSNNSNFNFLKTRSGTQFDPSAKSFQDSTEPDQVHSNLPFMEEEGPSSIMFKSKKQRKYDEDIMNILYESSHSEHSEGEIQKLNVLCNLSSDNGSSDREISINKLNVAKKMDTINLENPRKKHKKSNPTSNEKKQVFINSRILILIISFLIN